MPDAETHIPARLWLTPSDFDEDHEGKPVEVQVRRDEYEPGVVVHTFIDGEGSKVSYYLDPEAAIELARQILKVVPLR